MNHINEMYWAYMEVQQNQELLNEGTAFKNQYGKKGKLSQSSKRKSLGRGSSIKDGAKPSGYESKREYRDSEAELGEGAIADRMRELNKKKKARWDENSKKDKKKAYDALDRAKKTQAELDKSSFINNIDEAYIEYIARRLKHHLSN